MSQGIPAVLDPKWVGALDAALRAINQPAASKAEAWDHYHLPAREAATSIRAGRADRVIDA